MKSNGATYTKASTSASVSLLHGVAEGKNTKLYKKKAKDVTHLTVPPLIGSDQRKREK